MSIPGYDAWKLQEPPDNSETVCRCCGDHFDVNDNVGDEDYHVCRDCRGEVVRCLDCNAVTTDPQGGSWTRYPEGWVCEHCEEDREYVRVKAEEAKAEMGGAQ